MPLVKRKHTTDVTAVSATADEADRTLTITTEALKRGRKVGLYAKLEIDTATELVVTAYKSPDGGTSWGRTVPTAGQPDGIYQPTADATEIEVYLSFDVEDADGLKIVLSTKDGGVDDTLTGVAIVAYDK